MQFDSKEQKSRCGKFFPACDFWSPLDICLVPHQRQKICEQVLQRVKVLQLPSKSESLGTLGFQEVSVLCNSKPNIFDITLVCWPPSTEALLIDWAFI